MPSMDWPELLSESNLSWEELLSNDEQLQNSSPEETLLSSQDNMSDDTICHHDDKIEIDDDGSEEVPLSINVSLALFIHKTQSSGDNCGTTKNKYVTFISHVDEKQVVNIKLKNGCLWK